MIVKSPHLNLLDKASFTTKFQIESARTKLLKMANIKAELNKWYLNNKKCNVLESFIHHANHESSCWDLAERTGDFRFEYNVCLDCIVYIQLKKLHCS